ncbi:MAG TPA: phosphate ABC transporter permease PstA [Solirubrobacterales bacterium]
MSANPHALLLDRGNLKRRNRFNRAVSVASTSAALLAVAVLLIVVGSVLLKGVGALSWHFLTTPSGLFGDTSGGIANAIVGSAIIVAIAAAMAIPVGILIAIYTTEFAPPAIAHPVRFVLDILNGVPTIITGIFVFGLLVEGNKQSGFAASVALAIVMLPIVARTAQEVLGLVPKTLKEASHALGIAPWRATVRITIPTAAGGLITGSLLAIARVAGETAPIILLSSIVGQGVLTDPSQALASIPYFIFTSSETPSAEAHTQAWAAALVLIAFVLVLNIVARAFYARSRKRMGG